MKKNFNSCIRKVLEYAEEEMLSLNHPYVGTEHLLLALLKCEKTNKILKKYNLTYEIFKNELISIVGMSNIKSEYILYTPLLKLVLNKTLEEKDETIDEITLLKELISSDDGIAIRIMLELNIDLDSLYNDLMNNHSYLDEIGINMLEQCTEEILIGREKELNTIIEILMRKNKNNPVLVGEAGIGKSAIVYELAKRIKEKHVPIALQNSVIYMLDMASMLSNTKYRGEFETKMNNLIKEVEKRENIILFIDEIHTIVKTGGSEGSCDAANILKPYLATNKIKLIGATTTNEYDEYISKDAALSRRFAKIFIHEPTKEETLTILQGVKKSYEDYHLIKINDNILKTIVDYSTKYITNNQNPDKSLEVLDCLLSRINLKNYQGNETFKYNEFLKNKDYKNALKIKLASNNKEITENDVISVIEDLTNIKILNKNDYDNLCKKLDQKIYGQDLTTLKFLLKNKFITNKICSFEIRGEKGVGKSYTAKLIASTLNYNLIELDMKEYSSPTAINRLIGTDPGYVGYEEKSILDKIKYSPYSLILLKDIEYAHPNIINLFNSITEKGYLIDKKNNKIDFNLTMIIKTSALKQSKIGYQDNIKDNDNIVNYRLIDKKDIKKYLLDNNLNQDYLEKIEAKTTFDNLHYLMNEVPLNN